MNRGALACHYQRATGLLNNWLGTDLIALCGRIALAAIFWLSGRTKVVEGSWLAVSDSATMLFREEYRVPLLDPVVAAHMATYAEHLFPILLLLGLGTRFAALGLLGMTAVIQFFVYPDAWPTHLSWATLMLYLLAQGGGKLSLDAPIARMLRASPATPSNASGTLRG